MPAHVRRGVFKRVEGSTSASRSGRTGTEMTLLAWMDVFGMCSGSSAGGCVVKTGEAWVWRDGGSLEIEAYAKETSGSAWWWIWVACSPCSIRKDG